jgi:hypothetical protein
MHIFLYIILFFYKYFLHEYYIMIIFYHDQEFDFLKLFFENLVAWLENN